MIKPFFLGALTCYLGRWKPSDGPNARDNSSSAAIVSVSNHDLAKERFDGALALQRVGDAGGDTVEDHIRWFVDLASPL